MARTRRNKQSKAVRPATPSPDPPPPKEAGDPAAAEPAEARRSRPVLVWVSGIVAAVIVTASGVVFTGWFNSLGSAVFDEIGNTPPVTVAHVMTQNELLELALREPVTAPQDRAILLGRPNETQREAFLDRYQAAGVEQMWIAIVLQGNRAGLRITDVRPRVLRRAPLHDGALLKPKSAGEAPAIQLISDLDRADRRPTTPKDRRTPYFSAKQIDLVRGEQTTLSITMTADKAFYEFDFVATIVSDGRAVQMTIKRPDGRPFRLTGRAKKYGAIYRDAPSGAWESPAICDWKQEGC